jgi:hypothetical protein
MVTADLYILAKAAESDQGRKEQNRVTTGQSSIARSVASLCAVPLRNYSYVYITRKSTRGMLLNQFQEFEGISSQRIYSRLLAQADLV